MRRSAGTLVEDCAWGGSGSGWVVVDVAGRASHNQVGVAIQGSHGKSSGHLQLCAWASLRTVPGTHPTPPTQACDACIPHTCPPACTCPPHTHVHLPHPTPQTAPLFRCAVGRRSGCTAGPAATQRSSRRGQQGGRWQEGHGRRLHQRSTRLRGGTARLAVGWLSYEVQRAVICWYVA